MNRVNNCTRTLKIFLKFSNDKTLRTCFIHVDGLYGVTWEHLNNSGSCFHPRPGRRS